MRNKNNGVRGVLRSGRAGVRELSDPLPPGSGEVEVRIRTASDEREQGIDFSAAWEHGAGPLWGMSCRPQYPSEGPQWYGQPTSSERSAAAAERPKPGI